MDELGVVLDVNVYLDALVSRRAAAGWVPPVGSRRPSGRMSAAADCVRLFVDPVRGNVAPFLYVDEALDDLVIRKLTEPVVGAGGRGLGWDLDQALGAYQTLVDELADGGRVAHVAPSANAYTVPGIEDYEDARIYGLFHAVRRDPERVPILVTWDAKFASAVNAAAPRSTSGERLWFATEARQLCREVSRRRKTFYAA